MSHDGRPSRHGFSTMGCPAELCIYAKSKAEALQAMRIACDETRRLDRKYSHYRKGSLLTRLQRSASQPGGAQVDPETAALLNFASCQYQQSEGRFDITAGRLTRLWQEALDLPTADEIEQALARTGWNKVIWDDSRLQLPPGIQLDLGGIVKEYAADRVALLLRQAGFESGYIDLGGDLHFLGAHPDGRSWNVGIHHPRKRGVLACVDVYRGGLASSGDYERYRMINGTRYSHIIDARTGWPVESLASVSVIAPSCLIAGAVCTMAMLLDGNEAMEFLNQSGLHWLGHDGKNHCSTGSSYHSGSKELLPRGEYRQGPVA